MKIPNEGGTGVTDRYYYQVAGGESETQDYVIPDGKTLLINEIGGNSIYDPKVHVQVILDPGGAEHKCVFVTHGDDVRHDPFQFEGNGSKVVRILLNNDSTNYETIGGYWKGTLY